MNRELYDLTNPQKSIWLTEQFYKGSSVNNVCGTVLIDEIVNFDNLCTAINTFIRDNDSFRIHLSIDSNGNVKQYFSDYVEQTFKITNVDNNDDLLELENKMATTPFSVIENNLFDIRPFKFPNGKGGFVVNTSHLIADACTASLVASKIMNIYSSLLKNECPSEQATSYLNYINSEKEYLASQKFEKDKEYWDSQFTTVPEFGIIPSSKSSTIESPTACRQLFKIDSSLAENINSFCKDKKISLFNFFMGIYALYVGRVSNLDEFVLGTPILNRTTFTEKNTPGMFISTVPFKFSIVESQSFVEFVQKIGLDSLSMFRHQKYPYQNILEHIRKTNPSQPNLYDILISYQNSKTNRTSSDIPYMVRWTFNQNVADSMQIHIFDMNDEGELNVAYDYRTTKYDKSDILNMHKRMLYIIHQILSTDNIAISDIDIITPDEKNLLLNTFNNTFIGYNHNQTVIDYFEEQVRNTPDNIALVFGDTTFTYNDLNKKINSLAHHLIDSGIKQHDIVGIMLHRSPEMIIGIIATLKIGATYLPIDPEYPIDRINYMLNDSNTQTILVHNSTLNLLDNKNYNIININLESNIYNAPVNNPDIKISPDDLIYVIYTSGSTGNPKGVMVTHKNINNFIISVKKLINFSPNKTMVSVTTICFDIFALELWCSLTSGMKLVLASDSEQSSPELLQTLCINNSVNMIQTTPSRYSAILGDFSSPEFFKSFTDIMVGGEPFPDNLLEKLQLYSNANIFNMYGPTETTVWSTIKNLTRTDNITVGTPIGNTYCYILDKHKRLLPIGVPGELYIGGDGVTNGYLNREELTKEKFVISPFKDNDIIYNTGDLAYINSNGEIVHLGRTDFQVKIRGYRIELNEIKSRLLTFKNINNTVVVAKDNKFLICYYVSDEEYSSADMTSYLLSYLPHYMIPAYFIRIDKIPLTPNGKLNKQLLPDIQENQKVEKAHSEVEKKISKVLGEILNTPTLDINTPFLNLGLDSLGIIQAQTKLLKYNYILSTQDFYKYSTIKKLAEKIDNNIYNYQEQDIQIPLEFRHTDDELLPILSNFNVNEDILHNVFLTGANGFVGIHILHEILNSTNNTIYCLVRGKSHEHSVSRLISAYKFYFNTDISNFINSRVIVVSGDIDLPNFGIDISVFNNYINNFYTIIHTAAIVKHYGSFAEFDKINIQGTKNVVDFANAYKKRLIHISSISVSGNYLVHQNNKNIEFSENSLYIGQHYTDNVYVHSKFEAERIVLSAMQNGLTAQIIRIGILSGRYSDGVFQEKIVENAFYSRIKAMVSLGAISNDMLEQEIEFTPVDICAKSIVALSKNSICNNKIFHLYNPHLIKVKKLVKLFENFGINVKILSRKDFNNYLKEISSDENSSSLSAIINDFSYDSDNLLSLNYDFTVNIKSDYTQRFLHLLDCDWPITDDIYLNKLLDYMRTVKFI
ncbi:MAG: amino acid adenylation domain-containing protein [Clostridia bacterium]